MAHKLQCKPIEGYDIPLSELQKQLQNQQTGETKAKLLEIENIEGIQQEISDTEEILSMLMPNQLKKPSMQFLEVEDIRALRVQADAPKTKA